MPQVKFKSTREALGILYLVAEELLGDWTLQEIKKEPLGVQLMTLQERLNIPDTFLLIEGG